MTHSKPTAAPEPAARPEPTPAPERAARRYTERFGMAPRLLVRAPGRVNVIGEHTDYNEGFVLPAAVDRTLWMALAPAGGGTVEVESADAAGQARFDLDALATPQGGDANPGATAPPRLSGWGAYVQGMAWALAQAGYALAGWRGVIASDIPIGAGLSSSAALGLAVARAFEASSGFDWDPVVMARMAQRAENDWVGVATGIMDQLACAAGRPAHALLIDCRTLTLEPVRLPADVRLVVLDTGTRRELAASAYGERRRECEAAARALGVPALRDLDAGDLDAGGGGLDPVLQARARHVAGENARTLAAADAMRAGDAARLGALMDDSHASLRDDFEVSAPALDAIVEAARRLDGCHGARMTGGGFAGCALALVDETAVPTFAAALPTRYRERTGLDATVHVCAAAAGASIEWSG